MIADVFGRVQNTRLHPSNALMPLFEAVMNSIQSLALTPGDPASQRITIDLERQPSLLPNDNSGAVHGFSVTDNGAGFNQENLASFFTADSRHKADIGGKGIGRFVWLKEFAAADIESHYVDGDSMKLREFTFSLSSGEPSEPVNSSEAQPRTTVRLRGMKEEFLGKWPRELDQIAQRIVEHCLDFFLEPAHPTMILTDGADTMDLGDWYAESFDNHSTKHSFELAGVTFHLRGFRRFGPHAPRHELVYAADSRKVLSEYLYHHVPNLGRKLQDDGKSFVYMGFIESDFLNDNVNAERTDFSFPLAADPEEHQLQDSITRAAIRDQAIAFVREDLAPFLDEINLEKTETYGTFIRDAAPRYRHLLPHLPEVAERLTLSSDPKVLDSALRAVQFEEEERVSTESSALKAAFHSGVMPAATYEERLENVVQKSNDIGKSFLAQYVSHRKVMLDFLEESVQADPETSKYSLEKMVHRIIYPMGVTSDEVRYEDQNLWIIDERLAYHTFLASDIRLSSWKAIESESADRPDIAVLNMFESPLGFRDASDEGALNSIVIIEFKRPMRKDLGQETPLDQVVRLLESIRAGQRLDDKGTPIRLQNPEKTPAFLYVVGDLTPAMEHACRMAQLTLAPDNLGYFGFNPNYHAYFEVISYKKLLSDAKKRNRVLFDKLFLTH
jgi:hypothetical protein